MTLSVLKISIKESSSQANWFLGIVFLYFLFLSGECLEFPIGPIEIKLSRCFGCILFFILLLSNRFRLIDKKFFACFLWIFSSFVLSSFFSCHFMRSIAGCAAGIFTYTCFFLVPLNLMLLYDRHKIFRLYFLSFVCVGIHALGQFILSFFGVYDIFVTQRAGITSIARGQSWTFEPSFYALFATAFVFFFNARFLLSEKASSFWSLLAVNLLLLISTSTGGFFSYFVFFCVCLILSLFSYVKWHFPFLRRKLYKFFVVFFSFFIGIGCIFWEMFLHTFYKFFYMGFLSHWSFNERWEKIKESWDLFLQSPLFGVGLRAIEHHLYLKAHFNNSDVRLLSEVDSKREFYLAYSTSNVFMEILASLGIYGLCAFIGFAILLYQTFTSFIKDTRMPREERKIVLSFFISIIVMMVCLQFNQEIFRIYVWAHVGISLGYLLNVRSEYLRV